ncbi:TPA: hypothetical protein KAV15_002786 [Escherichia coli]|uniref:hypothetical protein n=1 Tax=Escherichia coli TaxID=562 RepID=UPI002996B40E|nr:hypothetical protein [Escherichia coli]
MKIFKVVLAVLTLSVIGVKTSYAYDLPKDVTLVCTDNETVFIHFGTDEPQGAIKDTVYLKLPDTETVNIPLRAARFVDNNKALRMDFVKIFDDHRAVVRKLLLEDGSYYKADNKTNKLMDCNVKNATY